MIGSAVLATVEIDIGIDQNSAWDRVRSWAPSNPGQILSIAIRLPDFGSKENNVRRMRKSQTVLLSYSEFDKSNNSFESSQFGAPPYCLAHQDFLRPNPYGIARSFDNDAFRSQQGILLENYRLVVIAGSGCLGTMLTGL